MEGTAAYNRMEVWAIHQVVEDARYARQTALLHVWRRGGCWVTQPVLGQHGPNNP